MVKTEKSLVQQFRDRQQAEHDQMMQSIHEEQRFLSKVLIAGVTAFAAFEIVGRIIDRRNARKSQ